MSPFLGQTRDEVFENITSKDVQLPERFSSQAQDFFKWSTNRHVSQRMNVSEMLTHPWIRKNTQPTETTDLDSAAYTESTSVCFRERPGLSYGVLKHYLVA